MTFDLKIYCKKEPCLDNLVKSLALEHLPRETEEYKDYLWKPTDASHGVLVGLKEGCRIVSEVYDGLTVEDYLLKAKEKGINVPDEFLRKILIDNVGDDQETIVGVVLGKGDSPQSPAVTRRIISDNNYTFRADAQMQLILQNHPRLIDCHPFFTEILGLAYLVGSQVYEIILETNQFANHTTLKPMIGLTHYLAQEFNGVIYEDQINRYGLPSVKELESLGAPFALLSSQGKEAHESKAHKTGLIHLEE